jgi:hypothetical protein
LVFEKCRSAARLGDKLITIQKDFVVVAFVVTSNHVIG